MLHWLLLLLAVRAFACAGDVAPAVDVWLAPIPADASAESLLTPDERDRASRIRIDAKRTQFVQSRAFVRRALGGYFTASPFPHPFFVTEAGKPHLPAALFKLPSFNWSHSHDRVLLAVAHADGVSVGADVERIAPDRDWRLWAPRLLAPAEQRYVASLDEGAAGRAIHRLWVLKEAALKAEGTGIDRPLPTLSVVDERGDVVWDGDWAPVHRWMHYEETDDGYGFAVVVEAAKTLPAFTVIRRAFADSAAR